MPTSPQKTKACWVWKVSRYFQYFLRTVQNCQVWSLSDEQDWSRNPTFPFRNTAWLPRQLPAGPHINYQKLGVFLCCCFCLSFALIFYCHFTLLFFCWFFFFGSLVPFFNMIATCTALTGLIQLGIFSVSFFLCFVSVSDNWEINY